MSGRFLEAFIEQFRRGYAGRKWGCHSFYAGAVCKKLGQVPPLSEVARDLVPLRLVDLGA